jgi:hypothetical protein
MQSFVCRTVLHFCRAGVNVQDQKSLIHATQQSQQEILADLSKDQL